MERLVSHGSPFPGTVRPCSWMHTGDREEGPASEVDLFSMAGAPPRRRRLRQRATNAQALCSFAVLAAVGPPSLAVPGIRVSMALPVLAACSISVHEMPVSGTFMRRAHSVLR